ncbi:MAG: hypothetical protein ACK56I_05890, partial [bacterium]
IEPRLITIIGRLPTEVLAVLVRVPILVAVVEVALQRVGGILIRIAGATNGSQGDSKEEKRFHHCAD